jgi:hypothetical protein
MKPFSEASPITVGLGFTIGSMIFAAALKLASIEAQGRAIADIQIRMEAYERQSRENSSRLIRIETILERIDKGR